MKVSLAMSHLQVAGVDPGLFLQKEHTMQKTASTVAAAASTPQASFSKTPVAGHYSSTLTTSIPIGSNRGYSDSPELWANKRRAEAIIVDSWPQPTELGSWKLSFKNVVSFFAIPRAAMLWIGEVEDAKSIDDIIVSASLSGRPILDFENLDFKIASGLVKILTGTCFQQVTTAEGKTQSQKRSLTGRLITWMICDFFEISGDNEAIWT